MFKLKTQRFFMWKNEVPSVFIQTNFVICFVWKSSEAPHVLIFRSRIRMCLMCKLWTMYELYCVWYFKTEITLGVRKWSCKSIEMNFAAFLKNYKNLIWLYILFYRWIIVLHYLANVFSKFSSFYSMWYIEALTKDLEKVWILALYHF